MMNESFDFLHALIRVSPRVGGGIYELLFYYGETRPRRKRSHPLLGTSITILSASPEVNGPILAFRTDSFSRASLFHLVPRARRRDSSRRRL